MHGLFCIHLTCSVGHCLLEQLLARRNAHALDMYGLSNRVAEALAWLLPPESGKLSALGCVHCMAVISGALPGLCPSSRSGRDAHTATCLVHAGEEYQED